MTRKKLKQLEVEGAHAPVPHIAGDANVIICALNMRSDWFFHAFIILTDDSQQKAMLWQGNRAYDAVEKLDA